MADQKVTSNNVRQQIAMPIAIIRYLQIKTLNKDTNPKLMPHRLMQICTDKTRLCK